MKRVTDHTFDAHLTNQKSPTRPMELRREYQELPVSGEPDSIKIAFPEPAEVEAILKVFNFMDHEYHILYVPSLKLSATTVVCGTQTTVFQV